MGGPLGFGLEFSLISPGFGSPVGMPQPPGSAADRVRASGTGVLRRSMAVARLLGVVAAAAALAEAASNEATSQATAAQAVCDVFNDDIESDYW